MISWIAFSGVIGIADGCHIRISKPSFEKDPLQQEKFFNRKGYYSWNALGVIDDTLRFIYFSCKYPGNAHDSRVYNESRLKAKLEETYDENAPRHLIGDKGYQLQKTMLIPVREDQVITQAQKDFIRMFIKLRIKVEHAFGILKKFFPALLYGLRKDKVLNSQATVFAAVVLYNMARDFNEPEPILPQDMTIGQFDQLVRDSTINQACRLQDRDKQIRNLIIDTYFS